MRRSFFFLSAVVAAVMASGCNRPEGGWRDQIQDQAETTPSGPMPLPQVETDSSDESAELLDQLDELLDDLDDSLNSESDWQLDVPDGYEVDSEDQANAAIIEDLLSQLASSLGTLDGALASESALQVDPP